MRVIIVGGGSAGWITAATLQARINGRGLGPLHITVVESPDTPTIGVNVTPPLSTPFNSKIGTVLDRNFYTHFIESKALS